MELLRKQADEHRAAASAAKGEAASANAQAEFERARYASLSESAAAARRDVEQLVEKNSSQARQVANHEAALRTQSVGPGYLSILHFESNDQNPTVNPPFKPPGGAQSKRP